MKLERFYNIVACVFMFALMGLLLHEVTDEPEIIYVNNTEWQSVDTLPMEQDVLMIVETPTLSENKKQVMFGQKYTFLGEVMYDLQSSIHTTMNLNEDEYGKEAIITHWIPLPTIESN